MNFRPTAADGHGAAAAKRWHALAAAAAALIVAAAADPSLATPDEAVRTYDEAMQRHEKGDLPGAALQLKRAIQADRTLLPAHVQLGRILMHSGELQAAAAALEEALTQGVDRSEVAVSLGRVYLKLGETGKLLERITTSGLTATQQSEVLTLRGSALAMSGSLGNAAQSFAEARSLDPRAAGPLVAEASMQLRSGDRERANALATEATVLEPASTVAWIQRGSVLHAMRDFQGALAAFEKALALDARHVDAHVGRATVLLALSRVDEVDAELALLKTWRAIEPRVSYLRAARSAQKGDAAAARASYAEAAGMIDAMPAVLRIGSEPLLMVGALSHRELGNLAKAREHLETLLNRNSRHLGAQLLLASILVETKDHVRATLWLDSLQRLSPDHPQVLFLYGSIHLARKQYAQVVDYFERAATRTADTNPIRELGLSQIASGRDKAGIANLETAFAKNSKDLRAGVQLAVTLARQGQDARAVRLAESLARNDPGNLAMLNFLANILSRTGDKRGARQVFEQLLAKDPANRPAGINLGWLDIEERRFDEARVRLRKMLSRQADDPDVLYELGVLESRSGHVDEALKTWQRAEDFQRRDPRPGLAIVDALEQQRKSAAALVAAKALAARFPDDITVQLTLSRTYFNGGEPVLGKLALQDATRMVGFDAERQVHIGRLQLLAGNTDAASYNATKALQARPGDVAAMVLQLEIEASRRNPSAVDAALKALNAMHPGELPTVLATAGVAMSRGQLQAAQAGFGAAMGMAPNTGIAILLAQSHVAAKEFDSALRVIADWARAHPQDRTALKALAEVQLGAGKSEAARQTYSLIVAGAPDDPQTLSDYSMLLHRMNHPAAIEQAEKAAKLAPTDAVFADRLGWILVRKGQLDSGLRHLRDARLRQPNSTEIRYHLAFALNRSGRAREARDELSAALASAVRPSAEMLSHCCPVKS
jgi:putative PEP-CTERM system TPR-repeat lipoprotein